MRPRDTTREAHRDQLALWQQLSASERVEIAVELSESTREIALAGISARHPEYERTSAEFALFRLLYGDDVFRTVWSGKPLLSP